MNNKKKNIFALIVASALAFASFTGALAAENEEVSAEEIAVTQTVAEETETADTVEEAEEKPAEELSE